MGELTQNLAAFALAPLPDTEAKEVMRLSMLDWAAVGLAGAHEPVARLLRAQAEGEAGAPEASLIGAQTRVPARMAALVNGATSHALDYDDTHFAHIGHPSVAVIPATLAVAEKVGATGAALQEAALVGAEASIRVGLWLGRGHYQTGFHQTATAGAFGAAVAAGRLLGLSETEMTSAIGLVSTRASGLKSQFGTMGKPLNAGLAASNGAEAALLAARGFASYPDGLEGPQGFGETHHGAGDLTALDGLGRDWLVKTVQHKFHACCHGLHATLEALMRFEGDREAIGQITIATHPRWLRVCNIAAPRTGLEAKFSYAHVAALSLAGHDTARLESFDDSLTGDTNLSALRGRVDIVADDTLTEMQARVMLSLIDGSEQTLFHDLDVPVPMRDRTARIRAKATALLGEARAHTLWDLIQSEAPPRDLAAALAKPL